MKPFKFWFLCSWIVGLPLVVLPNLLQAEPRQTLRNAQAAVHHAWDVYHHAALSGTLASPRIQTQIEQDLHQARQLLIDLQDKAQTGQEKDLRADFAQIKRLTEDIIQSSRRQKP